MLDPAIIQVAALYVAMVAVPFIPSIPARPIRFAMNHSKFCRDVYELRWGFAAVATVIAMFPAVVALAFYFR
jgi:hypothetical protein